MITFIITFLAAFLFNLYVTLFGEKDLEALKQKISFRKYYKELMNSLAEIIGDGGVTIFKLSIIGLGVLFVLLNPLMLLEFCVALWVGTWAAKKSYQVPAISNVLRKVATYINRLR